MNGPMVSQAQESEKLIAWLRKTLTDNCSLSVGYNKYYDEATFRPQIITITKYVENPVYGYQHFYCRVYYSSSEYQGPSLQFGEAKGSEDFQSRSETDPDMTLKVCKALIEAWLDQTYR